MATPSQAPDRKTGPNEEIVPRDSHSPVEHNPLHSKGQDLGEETTTTITNTHTLQHLSGSRSFPTALLQTLIKPFKPRLISPPKDPPQLGEDGGRSPRLDPPKKKLGARERREEGGLWVYDVLPQSSGSGDVGGKKGGRKKRVYYFSGGGFVAPPSGDHWSFVGEVVKKVNELDRNRGRKGSMAKKEEEERRKRASVRLSGGSTDDWNHRCLQAMRGGQQRRGKEEEDVAQDEQEERETIMTVVSLPLAPATPAPLALPLLNRWFGSVLQRNDDEDVVLMGDSSGGNLALTMVLNHYNGAFGEVEKEVKTVKAVVLISPTLDLQKANPDMLEAEKRDPVQTVQSSKEGAEQWRGEWEATDARLSPVNVDDKSLKALAERGIQVHGICGSHDILYPDFVLMRKRLEQNGVGGEWLEWEKQMHCFPLAWQYGLKESVQGKDWVADVVRRS